MATRDDFSNFVSLDDLSQPYDNICDIWWWPMNDPDNLLRRPVDNPDANTLWRPVDDPGNNWWLLLQPMMKTLSTLVMTLTYDDG